MRDCHKIIREMINCIPKEEIDLINALEWNYNDAWYKSPEETIHWIRTSETLQKYINPPDINKNWQIKILSIFSTISEEDIIKELSSNE